MTDKRAAAVDVIGAVPDEDAVRSRNGARRKKHGGTGAPKKKRSAGKKARKRRDARLRRLIGVGGASALLALGVLVGAIGASLGRKSKH